jgi:hypothetical protein
VHHKVERVSEQRNNPRKILKVKAVVAMDGQAPVPGRTGDLGANGVSINVPSPLQAGQTGQVAFDLLIDGKPTPLHARARVTHCIFSGDEFKVGFQFLNLDLQAMSNLSRFLR